MAQAKISIDQRIERLRQAADRARALKRGTTLTAKPMAELLGVSWDVLRGWVNTIDGLEEAAQVQRGSHGIPWIFKPLKTCNALTKHFKQVQREESDRAKKQIKVAAGATIEPPREAMSLRDMRDLLVLNREVTDEQERQGKLANAEAIKAILQHVFGEMQAAGINTAQRLDPNGAWSAETRAIVDEVVRELMTEQERAAHEALSSF